MDMDLHMDVHRDVHGAVYGVKDVKSVDSVCGKAGLFLAKVLVSPHNKLIASGGQDGLSRPPTSAKPQYTERHQERMRTNTVNQPFSGNAAYRFLLICFT